MLLVVLLVLGKDQDIVDIYAIEIVEVAHQRIINEPLEGRRAVGQAEWQDLIAVGTVPRSKGRQIDTLWAHPDPMKRLADIDLCKYLRLSNPGKGFID